MLPADTRRLRILVVDDSALARRWFATLLADHEVSFAADGQAALALLSGELDLVISDCQMPGLGGVELLQRVRQVVPKAARVMCTASGKDAALTALAAGIVTRVLDKGDAAGVLAELAAITALTRPAG